MKFEIKNFDILKSTNSYLETLAKNGADEGLVVVAQAQSEGRGRFERSFFSPRGGIYMSLLLTPPKSEDAVFVTAAAGVAVSDALLSVLNIETQIKWVNDIFYRGKKICGILAKSFPSADRNNIILGIGINLAPPSEDYPEEIKNIAGAIFSETPPPEIRGRLISEILKRFADYYELKKPYIEKYRSRSCLIGKEITFIKDGRELCASVVGIDDFAGLEIKFSDGKTETLRMGEISVRQK